MGLLIMKIYCGKLSFDTLGCNKTLALFEVAFILTTRLLELIASEGSKDGG
jgi:hypothetical protein